jgi:hypothetical protein
LISIFRVILLPFIIAISLTLADGFEGPIASCTDVSCPLNGPLDTCTVTNRTFDGIGLVRVPNLPSSHSGVSLVKGVGFDYSRDDLNNSALVEDLERNMASSRSLARCTT